ncbi:hypothetical protein FRB91_007845 [Serendipita sp. 411]|nr:hypothetical protein FRB91_007845 [Serendipita sp. 411]
MIDALQNVDETVPLDIPEGHLVQDPDVLSSSSVLPNEVPAHSQQEIHPASGPTRRILPQRTRKVGFGTHDADLLILEAIANDEKLKGAIPPETVIHCTTNSAALPNARAIIDQIKFECDLDVHGDATQGTEGANLSLHSYFRNAEVMHSLRRQTQIETGKFELVTTQMIEDALQDVPEPLLQKPADLTDEMFRRRHLRAQKVETRSRIREKELLNHEVSRLQDRIPQLEVMDPTGFRGETAEEQEHDKQKILRYARQLISKSTHNKEPSVSEPDLDGAELHSRPPNRPEKKPKANGTARKSKPKLTTTAEELMEIGAPIHKPKKEPKSSRFVYVDDYDMEDPLSPGLPYGRDEEYVEKVSKKKKKGKKGTDLGKRKRDIEFEMDITSVPEIVTAPKKKPKSTTGYTKKKISLSPVYHRPHGDRASSKLMEQATKYNPNRASRDTLPFGVHMVSVLVTDIRDFDLPEWLSYSPNSAGMEEQLPHGEDEGLVEDPSSRVILEDADEAKDNSTSFHADEEEEEVDELDEDEEGDEDAEGEDDIEGEPEDGGTEGPEDAASSSLSPPESVGDGQGANMSGEAMQEDILKPELEPEPEQEQDIFPDEFEPVY